MSSTITRSQPLLRPDSAGRQDDHTLQNDRHPSNINIEQTQFTSGSRSRGAVGKRKPIHKDSREFEDATDEMLDVISQMEQLAIGSATDRTHESADSNLGDSGDTSPTTSTTHHEPKVAKFLLKGAHSSDEKNPSSPASDVDHPLLSSKSPTRHSRTLSPSGARGPSPNSPGDRPKNTSNMSASEKDLVRCYVIVDHMMALKNTSELLSTECYGQKPSSPSTGCYHFAQDTNLKVWDPDCVLDKMHTVLKHLGDAHDEWNLLPESLQAMYNVIALQITALKERIVATFRGILTEMRGLKRRRSSSPAASPSYPSPHDDVDGAGAHVTPNNRGGRGVRHEFKLDDVFSPQARSGASRSASRSASRERHLSAVDSHSRFSSTLRARKNSLTITSTPPPPIHEAGRRRQLPARHRASIPSPSRESSARKSSLSVKSEKVTVRKPSLSSTTTSARAVEPKGNNNSSGRSGRRDRKRSPSPAKHEHISIPAKPQPRVSEKTPAVSVQEDVDCMDDDREFVDQVCVFFQ